MAWPVCEAPDPAATLQTMGLFSRDKKPAEATPVPTPAAAASTTPTRFAREILAEFGESPSVDDWWDRAEAAGLDPVAVDRAMDRIREQGARKIERTEVTEADAVDLRGLDGIDANIAGISHWLTDAERKKFADDHYLLVREPHHEVDPNAIAVFGKSRKVGYVSAGRAKALAPILDSIGAVAYLVAGRGLTMNLPRIDPLRDFTEGR